MLTYSTRPFSGVLGGPQSTAVCVCVCGGGGGCVHVCVYICIPGIVSVS